MPCRLWRLVGCDGGRGGGGLGGGSVESRRHGGRVVMASEEGKEMGALARHVRERRGNWRGHSCLAAMVIGMAETRTNGMDCSQSSSEGGTPRCLRAKGAKGAEMRAQRVKTQPRDKDRERRERGLRGFSRLSSVRR